MPYNCAESEDDFGTSPQKVTHEQHAEIYDKGWKAGFKAGRAAFQREMRLLLDVPSFADVPETAGDR